VSWHESNSQFQDVPTTRVKSFLVYAFHQLLGTWGVAYLAAFGLFASFDMLPNLANWKPSSASVQWVLTENPFYPVQIVVGLCFGWMLGRRFNHRSMLWIWILPLAILVYAFAATPSLNPRGSIFSLPDTLQSRISYYFGWGCQPRGRCLDQLLITMPFYASVAYSLGALLARNTFTKPQKDSGAQMTSPEISLPK
jgi:hypothetical protein